MRTTRASADRAAYLSDIARAMGWLFDALYRPRAALVCEYDAKKDGFRLFACDEDWENYVEETFCAGGKTKEECAEFLFQRVMRFKPKRVRKDRPGDD